MTEEEAYKLACELLHKDYSNVTFSSTLREIFGEHNIKGIKQYIKPNREFWHYENSVWRKLKVTYTRSGVMFFVFDDEPNVEHAWFMSSFNAFSLCVAQIYPYDIQRILSEEYPDNNFVETCKQCKWDTYDGQIKIEIMWSNKDM